MFKHKNVGVSPIAIFDSHNKRFDLLPGETVMIDKDSSGQGVIIEKIRINTRRAKEIIVEDEESSEDD